MAIPPEIIGISTKRMMIPKTKSSCFPEVIFGIPKTVIPKYPTTNAIAIQSMPNIFLSPFILVVLKLVKKLSDFAVNREYYCSYF